MEREANSEKQNNMIQIIQRTTRASRFADFSTYSFQGAFLDRKVVEERVITVVKSMPSAPPSINPTARFAADLKFDSFHRKDLFERLSKEFCVNVPSEIADGFVSVESAVNFFAKHPKARWGPPSSF